MFTTAASRATMRVSSERISGGIALAAKKLLPVIAKDEVPKDGERQVVTVLVSDEDGKPVYSAALTYTGLWLLR